ncbi:MAG: hypothetical protein WBJ10_02345, partial [Daejeonella sp.]|uniref:hypothetical protein n=1 Tax=Daejeonella sp. TaxID=2805397 RepID=UPI003C76C355
TSAMVLFVVFGLLQLLMGREKIRVTKSFRPHFLASSKKSYLQKTNYPSQEFAEQLKLIYK